MELSDKHLAEVVRIFYETRTSSRVIKTMQKRHPELEKLNRMRVHRIVQKFEACGSIADGRRNNGRPRSVRSGENIDSVRKAIEETPKFLPALRRKDIDIESAWFQQDGAGPHTAAVVMQVARSNLRHSVRFVSFRECVAAPLPDLSPFGFFFCGGT